MISALTSVSSASAAASNNTSNNTGTFIQPSQIYGIDISSEMIKYAKELHPHCHFICGDLRNIIPIATSVVLRMKN
jgi:trans-aconitate methyltransferase